MTESFTITAGLNKPCAATGVPSISDADTSKGAISFLKLCMYVSPASSGIGFGSAPRGEAAQSNCKAQTGGGLKA